MSPGLPSTLGFCGLDSIANLPGDQLLKGLSTLLGAQVQSLGIVVDSSHFSTPNIESDSEC